MTDIDLGDSSDSEEDFIGPSSQKRKSGTLGSRPKFKQQSLHVGDHSPTRTTLLAPEEDISAFKRVLQEIPNNFLLSEIDLKLLNVETMFTPDLGSISSPAGSFDGRSADQAVQAIMSIRYSPEQLKHLRESPLVVKPPLLPPLWQWMG